MRWSWASPTRSTVLPPGALPPGGDPFNVFKPFVMQPGTVRGTLSLHDDGSGLPAEGWQRPGHYGLRWLVERVESLRGELRLDANLPHGVQLHVRVPLSAMEATTP